MKQPNITMAHNRVAIRKVMMDFRSVPALDIRPDTERRS